MKKIQLIVLTLVLAASLTDTTFAQYSSYQYYDTNYSNTYVNNSYAYTIGCTTYWYNSYTRVSTPTGSTCYNNYNNYNYQYSSQYSQPTYTYQYVQPTYTYQTVQPSYTYSYVQPTYNTTPTNTTYYYSNGSWYPSTNYNNAYQYQGYNSYNNYNCYYGNVYQVCY